jgi:hypothetical protein
LYRDHVPLCILSCFSTSVLYANRTPANAAVVLRALQQSTGELLGAAAEGVIATPTEKLAKTQSLFLYQVIRLFDGDIALRAQAEKDMVLLETWLRDLCRIRENLGGLSRLEDFRMSEQPPKEWEVSFRVGVVVLKICLLTSFVVDRDGSLPSLYEGPFL